MSTWVGVRLLSSSRNGMNCSGQYSASTDFTSAEWSGIWTEPSYMSRTSASFCSQSAMVFFIVLCKSNKRGHVAVPGMDHSFDVDCGWVVEASFGLAIDQEKS